MSALAGHDWALLATLLATLATLAGGQLLGLGLMAKAYIQRHGFAPHDRIIQGFYRSFSLERGVLVGGVSFLIGGGVLAALLAHSGGRDLAAPDTIWLGAVGMIALILGMQIASSSFLLALLHAAPDDALCVVADGVDVSPRCR